MLAAAILLLAVTTASGQDRQVQTILFVCEHGSAKSVIAAAHFNRLAEQSTCHTKLLLAELTLVQRYRSKSGSISLRTDWMFRHGSRS
jgi:hypothetical protein